MKVFWELLVFLIKQLFETTFFIIRLLAERLLKPLWIIVFLSIFIIFKNWLDISKTLFHLGISEYSLIKEYLELLFSWPFVVLIIILIFFFKFSQSIKKFLENSNLKKAGPLEFEQIGQKPTAKDIEEKTAENLQQEGVTLSVKQLQQIEKAILEKNTQLTNKDQAIQYFIERSELFEFAYLSLALVYNTKVALMWFYLQTGNSSTKENFLNTYILPPEVTDLQVEKEAIFNALLVNQLLEENGGLFRVTEKGKRFLKYLGFNIQQ